MQRQYMRKHDRNMHELDWSETDRAYQRVRTLRGKCRMDRGGEAAKRSRMESSSSDRRDQSEESRSGGNRERPGRGGRRAARPMTPPHRPPPPGTSPRRSPRLSQPGSPGDYRRLPLSTKSDRRTAHSRSASGDECRRHQSRSSRSGPGSKVQVKGTRATSAAELRRFHHGVTHDQFLHIYQLAPVLPGMGASGRGS